MTIAEWKASSWPQKVAGARAAVMHDPLKAVQDIDAEIVRRARPDKGVVPDERDEAA
jgi:stage V sporulation protein SpoVS